MERMTTAQAAKELNINVVGLQVLMQQEKLPIGYAVKKPGSTRFTYYIYKELVDGYKKNIEEGHLC